MGTVKRLSFQGVYNIIRFNRHYYVLILLILTGMYYFKNHLPASSHLIWSVFLILGLSILFITVTVSYYIYDYSSFYSLNWMAELKIQTGDRIGNINAGFDETSGILAEKYPGIDLSVYDFYDPRKHTEVSIKRARNAYPAYPGTVKIDSSNPEFPLKNLDFFLLIFAAHEIRSNEEREQFFNTLGQALKTNGQIMVVEHSRDLVNFLAFSLGFLHFYSRKSWIQTFEKAGLRIKLIKKINPFVTSYTLIPA
jgi:hypothetical protein